MFKFKRKGDGDRPFLSRLAGDVRGNTLAMMAIFLIPLTGLVGSAVDMGRLYVVKARLQQACDAGALAGRKFMVDSDGGALDTNAALQAKTFFANNFTSGYLGTPAFSATTTPYPFTPTKTADNQVAGTASIVVPMTISKIIGQSTVTLNVTCEARYDIADTDVMFVLDTTGSMACTTKDDPCGASPVAYTKPDGTTGYKATEESGSKIAGLRSAVLNFYDTVAGSSDPTTHIRYGFVTYTSTVNAGYALPTTAMVPQWSYQTRKVVGDMNNGSSTTTTYNNTKKSDCDAYVGRNPTTAMTYTTSGTAVVYTQQSFSQNSGDKGTGGAMVGTCKILNQPVKPIWRYAKWPLDVSQYITGANVDDPSKITTATSKWQGCVEELTTTATSSFDANNLPDDLDPDVIPIADVDASGYPTAKDTRWRPMWPDVVYYRGNNTSVDSNSWSAGSNSSNPYGDTTSTTQIGQGTALSLYNNIASGYVSCGKPVQRLATLSRSDVSNYVNAADFVPQGGTYHDTGMIWGTRLISPTGIFANDTAAWPGRNPPNRYIVFMTDGDMAPNACVYGMYGIENYDKRVTGGSYASSCSNSNDEDYHNARFLAECSAAKARNIKVFVVGFGQSLTTQLTNCASPGQAYYASDNTTLNTAFQNIAKQVAMLRVSK